MPYVAVYDVPGDDIEGYHEVNTALQKVGKYNPQGRLYHFVYTKNGGYVVVEVWDSLESLEHFKQTLRAVIHQLGGELVEPDDFLVHNIIEG